MGWNYFSLISADNIGELVCHDVTMRHHEDVLPANGASRRLKYRVIGWDQSLTQWILGLRKFSIFCGGVFGKNRIDHAI